ncbi:MAG: protein kinase [Elusimicrobia bacterium]|nr:protein kinase [Elusimicrobiota bacterium]
MRRTWLVAVCLLWPARFCAEPGGAVPSPVGAGARTSDPELAQADLDTDREIRRRVDSLSVLGRGLSPVEIGARQARIEALIWKINDFDHMMRLRKACDESLKGFKGYGIANAFNGRAKALAPGDWRVWAGSGGSYLEQKDYRTAFQDLKRALELGADSSEVLVNHGVAAYFLGDPKLAYRSARLALELEPGNSAAHALLKLSENHAPEVSLPDVLDANRKPGGLVATANPAPALTPARIAARAQAQSDAPAPAARQSRLLTQDVQAAMAVRDFSQAEALAARAIALDPRNAQAWNLRAIADNKLGKFAAAIYDSSFALGLTPGNAAALQTRSWALSKSGRFDEALADANYTLEQEPDDSFAFYNRAFAQAGLGDRDGVLDSLGRAAELDARFQQVRDRALQAPQGSDLRFLFDEVKAEPSPAAGAGRPRRFLRLLLLVALGGALVAFGLLSVLSPRLRQAVRSTFRRRPGAAPEADGFWSGYSVTRRIGSGGMGVVYEALDNALARKVAIKKMRDEIRADPAERRRFLAEARVVAALRHPNIVDIHSIVEDAGDIYLVFEFVAGRTLAELLLERGPLPWSRARDVLRQACAAVSYAHARGVIHRDLKPANIMLADDGRVKVMDFGVARRAQEAVTRAGRTDTIAGTPPYMAPEADRGAAGRESDVFALGACLYEMLGGKPPFMGDGAALRLDKVNGKFVPLSREVPGLPGGLDEVLAKALAAEPDSRYPSAEAFSAALDALPG